MKEEPGMIRTLDKLAHAIQAERGRHGGEGRKVFLDLDSRADLQYDLKAREVAGFLRSEANREALLRRLDATSVEYRPSRYHKASGGGYDVGFVQYRERPGRRDPASVKVTFGEAMGSPTAHATRKSGRQLDREIAEILVKSPSRVITAYHGSDVPIRRFDPSYSAQGVFWFSEDKDKILRGESGAVSTKYLVKALLHVNKTAGWDEYDRYSLDELENLGYDSIHLDDDWVIFDPNRIKIVTGKGCR
jgi:hypothetical protein